ncbi:MAG: septum formation initiator family protein [Streptococcaceae bacterium]|jgi:cell division protein DivIC|nr:septum formation initiator family protein [Streptococcaceae bacterium]
MSENPNVPNVLRLNNEYTNRQLEKQRHKSAPRRKYLGLILITVVIVLAIPTYGLVKSFQTLEKAKVTNVQVVSQSKAIEYKVSSQSEMIKNLQNSFYAQKYARSRYLYTKPGEKIFTVPSSPLTTESSTEK